MIQTDGRGKPLLRTFVAAWHYPAFRAWCQDNDVNWRLVTWLTEESQLRGIGEAQIVLADYWFRHHNADGIYRTADIQRSHFPETVTILNSAGEPFSD